MAASPSTKNQAQKHDPEMRSSKKGNQRCFGMKAHIGVDATSGLVHTEGATTGSVHDAKVMDNLIREDDPAVYGDKDMPANDRITTGGSSGRSAGREGESEARAPPVDIATPPQSPLRKNPRQGRIRVPGDECQFGYRKVRYRGITKNGAQVFALLALANLFLAHRTPASA